MSHYMDYSEWSAKAEPTSPLYTDDDWLICNSLGSDDGILATVSVPLSLIQDEKCIIDDDVSVEDEFEVIGLDTELSPEFISEFDDDVSQLVPSVKCEDISSPPYSPISTSGANSPNDKISRSQLASKLLDDLDNLKEERFPDWLEEKTELQIFEDFPSTTTSVNNAPLLLDYEASCDQTILKSSDVTVIQPSLYHLTPPQSPPELLYNGQQPFSPIWQTAPASVESTDVYKELNVVDELVLQAAQNIQWPELQSNPHLEEMKSVNYGNEFNLTVATPPVEISQENILPDDFSNVQCTYYEADCSSSSYSPSSPSSSSSSVYGSSENDDDYVDPPRKAKNRSGNRTKPYSRSVDDRKSRKKEQNKNAATRYRLKKKAEVEVLMGEEKVLQIKNDELTAQYTDIRRQVSCLKKFLREVFEAKGMLNK